MRFLVAAQLLRKLAVWLLEPGQDAIHTLELPACNATSDAEVVACAIREQRIVVTKDADFVHSFLISGRPPMLWLIPTGNISNARLESLIRANFTAIVAAFASARFVELSSNALTVQE